MTKIKVILFIDWIGGFFPTDDDVFAVPEEVTLNLPSLGIDYIAGATPGPKDEYGKMYRPPKKSKTLVNPPTILPPKEDWPKIGTSRRLGKRMCLSFPIEKTCLEESVYQKDPRRVCSGCYGKAQSPRGINAKFAIEAREHNYRVYKKNPNFFFGALAEIISRKKVGNKYFRWHIVGDIPDKRFVGLSLDLAKGLKKVQFWMPTLKYNLVSNEIPRSLPENYQIRFSSPVYGQVTNIQDYEYCAGIRRSVVYRDRKPREANAICPTSRYGGSCDSHNCEMCWSRSPEVIAYKEEKVEKFYKSYQ